MSKFIADQIKLPKQETPQEETPQERDQLPEESEDFHTQIKPDDTPDNTQVDMEQQSDGS